MKFLKAALLLNASSCIIFGAIFLAFSGSVSQFNGNPFNWIIPALGAILLFNGLHLVVASRRNTPLCPEIFYFVEYYKADLRNLQELYRRILDLKKIPVKLLNGQQIKL